MTDSVNLALDKKNLDTILVLDFGSQYTQLIARRVRELNVFSEILPWDISPERIKALNPNGIILSGGPESVTALNTPRVPEIVFDLEIPILGICFGHQIISKEPYTFSRTFSKGKYQDNVVVALDVPEGEVGIDVSSVFKDGDILLDYYSGKNLTVENGKILSTSFHKVFLLEKK